MDDSMQQLSQQVQPAMPGAPNPMMQGAVLPASGKAITALVLGIIAIPACVVYGIPSLICGGLAVMFYKHAVVEVEAGLRNLNSLSLGKAGMICGIVGMSLGGLYILILIAAVFIAMASPGT